MFGEYIQKIDEEMSRLCAELISLTPNEIKPAVVEFQKFVLRPGKRIRPLLLLLSYTGYNGERIDDAFLLACLVELMHSFLLIHDDIIDKSDLRRGEPTLHKVYEKLYDSPKLGTDVAIVIGDIVAFFVFGMISKLGLKEATLKRLISDFSKCYINTGFGQLLDVLSANRISVYGLSTNIPEKISELKTAYYTFVYPMLFGYLLTEKEDNSELEKIITTGKLAGIAFQYKDDIIGVFGGDAKTLNDLSEGKFTLLVKRTYELLSDDKKEIFKEKISKPNKSLEDLEFLKNLIVTSKAVESVKECINQLKEESIKTLDLLSIKQPEKGYLKELFSKALEIPKIEF
ncbi:MAG: polyprenyl synthetase family protein [Fervidobacterium sp.]|nr:polyprenyl synthetase family protein [Fervidobacterium sp.]